MDDLAAAARRRRRRSSAARSPARGATAAAARRAGRAGTALPDQLKLFQPAHGHFNLVAATLVCRMPGLPDRTLDVRRGRGASGSSCGGSSPTATGLGTARRVGLGRVRASGRGWRTCRRDAPAGAPARSSCRCSRALRAAADRAAAARRARPDVQRRDVQGAGAASAVADRDPAGPIGPGRQLETRVLDAARDARRGRIVALRRRRDRRRPAPDGRRRERDGAGGLAVRAARPRRPARRRTCPRVGARSGRGVGRRAGRGRALYELLRRATVGAGADRRCGAALLGRLGAAASGSPAKAEPAPDLRRRPARTRRLDRGAPSGRRSRRRARREPGRRPPARRRRDPPPTAADPAAVPEARPAATPLYVVRCVYRRPHCVPLPLDVVSEPTRAVRDRAVLRPRRAGPADPHRAPGRDLDRRPAQVPQERRLRCSPTSCASRWSRVTDMKAVLDGQLAVRATRSTSG